MGVLELLTWGAPPALILLDMHLRCMTGEGDGFNLDQALCQRFWGDCQAFDFVEFFSGKAVVTAALRTAAR